MGSLGFGWLLVGVAFGLRLLAIFSVGTLPSIHGYECEEISLNLIQGHGYAMAYFGPVAPTAHQYPLYCWLMAGHFSLFGVAYFPLQLTQALIGTLSCFALWRLGARLVDERVGRIAAMLCAIYPVYVYWTVRMQALTLEVLLLIAVLWLFDRAFERGHIRSFGVAGVVFGAACLSKALYLVFLPVILLWGIVRWKRTARWSVKPIAASLFAAALTIAPWTARNWRVLGTPIPISSNSGWNLYAGNNPKATGSSYAAPGVTMQKTLSRETVAALRLLDDVQKDAFFREAALRWIGENPGRFIALVPRKMRALWWFDPETPTDFRRVRVVIYLVLVLTTLMGVILARRHWNALWVFPGLYIVTSLAYALFYGAPRFRYALEWSFLLFAALAVERGSRGIRPLSEELNGERNV